VNDVSAKISKIIEKQPHVVFAFLFGSQASGKATGESDIDLAIYFEDGHVPEPFKSIDLQAEIAAQMSKDIDLVVLNRANPIIKMQVLKNGQLIFANDPKALSRFFVNAVMAYADLKRMRAGIEASLLSRRIHG